MTHPRFWSPEKAKAVAEVLVINNWSASAVLFALFELGPRTAEELQAAFAEENIIDQSPEDGMAELVSAGLATFSGPYDRPLVFHLTEDGKDLASCLNELTSFGKKNKKR
jgi:DNA-binding HxlR family transcriptional regulator